MNRPAYLRRCPFLVAAVLLFPGCKREEQKEEEKRPPAPVKVVAAQKEKLGERTELLGATQPLPRHAALVTAAVAGQVVWVLGEEGEKPLVEGQRVAKRDVLVQLDDRVAKATRDKTQALLDEQAVLKKQAGVARKLAQVDVDRLEALNAGRSTTNMPLVSRIDLEKARLALQDAELKGKAAEERERSLQADLRSLDIQLDLYKLRAPIAGVLGTVQANAGQTLSVGTVIAEVVNLEEIDAVCTVPPASAARLKLGQPAWLTVEDGEEVPAESRPQGRVEFIAVQAQAETGNFVVKVRFKNPQGRLRANAIVRVQVETRPADERLVIPESALMEDQSPPAVVIVEDIKTQKDEHGEEEKTGTARKLTAVIGVRDHEKHLVEIRGLEDPEKKEKIPPLAQAQFVVEGGHGLENGDAVKLEEEKEEKDEKADRKDEKDEKKDDKEVKDAAKGEKKDEK